MQELILCDGLSGGELGRCIQNHFLLVAVLSWPRRLLILIQCFPHILCEGVGRKRPVLSACECWIVSAWPWEFLFEGLSVVHESVPFGESRRVLRRLVFVFCVGLVLSWCWEFGDFLSNEVVDSLPARKTLLLDAVLLHKARLGVKGWARSVLALHELILPWLLADLAPWVRH